MRAVREAAGLSFAQLAAATGYSRVCLANVEAGRRAVTDEAIAEYVAAYDRALHTGGLLLDYWTAVQEGDEVRRRAVVFALSTLGSVAISGRDYVAEALRSSILNALGGDDWPELAAEHGRRFMSDPPAMFRSRLAGDLLNLKGAIENSDSASARGAAARLMTLQAMGTANLGDTHGAVRWYRAARVAADLAGDSELLTWVRGREAFRRGYEGARPAEVLAIAKGVDGQVEALLAVAQAYARLGETDLALRALDDARRCHDSSNQDETSIYAMPAWRMAVSTAYVFALLGQPDACMAELAGTPRPTLRRWHAQYELQMAVALTRSGDTAAGAAAAREVWGGLPADQRSIVVAQMMREATGREPVAA